MANGFSEDGPALAGPEEFTGRLLVLGRQAHDSQFPKLLRDKAGLTLASSSDFPRGTVDMRGLGGADGIYLEELGIAVASSTPDQVGVLAGPGAPADVAVVERERVVYLLDILRATVVPGLVPDEAVAVSTGGGEGLICSLVAPSMSVHPMNDEAAHTWGLQITKVLESTRTGRGVRVAVLDTGLDLQHPDFAGRAIVSHSFIDGQGAQDGHDHGTHCAGTAVGAARPPVLPRYGVAPDADLYVGKVIADNGRGADGSSLAGINWAVQNRCRVVSMSFGTAAREGRPHSQVYEAAAQRALAQNTLLVAAAGNESDRRRNETRPVGSPADCPSVMAVGAVDSNLRIAHFSTRGTATGGGAIDVVAPGVEVYSSVRMPKRHARFQGTSMACPHVAGIAALYCEAYPNASAREIWQMLVRDVRRLDLDAADAGAGLVQAPR